MTPDGGIIHEDALIARHPWIGASRLRAADATAACAY